jgi:hypothetical protein
MNTCPERCGANIIYNMEKVIWRTGILVQVVRVTFYRALYNIIIICDVYCVRIVDSYNSYSEQLTCSNRGGGFNRANMSDR